ncbi:hypothetical protein BV22DRAFT_1024606, partial [Leucogyrophana mollusca]
RLKFLPAYSPDLNPIEESFSAGKSGGYTEYQHAHLMLSIVKHYLHHRCHPCEGTWMVH